MRRTNASDSSAGPGSMWLNRRSRENEPARTRLGGSLTGCCGGKRSIVITILARRRRFLRTCRQAKSTWLRPCVLPLTEGGEHVDHNLRPRNIYDGVAIDESATIASGKRRQLPLYCHREWLHSLFPSRRQVSRAIVFLLQPGRQT